MEAVALSLYPRKSKPVLRVVCMYPLIEAA